VASHKIPDGLLRLILFAGIGLFLGAIFFGGAAHSEDMPEIGVSIDLTRNGPFICAAHPNWCKQSGYKCPEYADGAYDIYAEMLGVSIDLTHKREPFLSERRKFIEDACD
jgi:hypothetical protein